MSKLHLLFGIVAFAVFLVTGRFMRADFPDKDAIEQEFRMLMRSRHIYILMAALAHILLGLYFEFRPQPAQKALQILGSIFLFAGTVLLIYAFFYETYQLHGFSDLSRSGLYMTLAGTIFHILGGIRLKSKNDER